MSAVIKVIAIVFTLWMLITYWAGSSAYRIWQIKKVDAAVTLRLIKRTMVGWVFNPISKIEEGVREKAEISVSLKLLEGFTFTPRGGEVITGDFLRDRRQYLLIIANESKETFSDIQLRVQMPYPVENFQFGKAEKVDGVRFLPLGLSMSVGGSGSGQVEFRRTPLTRVYEFHASQLRPNGSVQLILLLNSWRDPRGKTIPPEEVARYFIPEWGPTLTYIHGYFLVRIGQEEIKKEYYVPLDLREDKTVVMGAPSVPPEGLMLETGFE